MASVTPTQKDAPATTGDDQAFQPRARSSYLISQVSALSGVIGLLVGAAIWQLLAIVWDVTFFPTVTAVVVRLYEMLIDGLLVINLLASLQNLFVGFAIAATVGVGVGMLMGVYPKVEAALDIYVNVFLTAPALIFAPIFFSFFGLSQLSIIALVIMYSMFIIIINTFTAIRSVPRELIEMGVSYNAKSRHLFFKIVLPYAMPFIMAGLRLGVGRAVKGMVNGEMFIAVVGIGAMIMAAGRRFDAESVLAILLLIIIVASVAVKIVQVIDKRLTSWLPETARS